MTAGRLLIFILLLNLSTGLYAQQKVSGKMYSATNDSVIIAGTVFNKNIGQSAYSKRDGSFSITASEGDTLMFSAMGYARETVIVQFHMLYTQYDVTLQLKMITLPTARVISSYHQDSLDKRNYYANIFKKQPGITGFNRPVDGVGISLSPLSYLSKKAKQQRALKKRLLNEEREDYIDRSFPVGWVGQLTQLKGDSLTLFMYRYRPSYSFCRKVGREEMLFYINEKLKEFKKSKNRVVSQFE